MDAFLPALPLLVLITALVLKRGAVVSSLLGSAAVLAVIWLDRRYALDFAAALSTDLPVVLILTLSVALVIVPGQILNALLQASGTLAAIGARIESLRLSRVKMASILILGVAPMLESLTGFGVSLFFTVPVLVRLFSLKKALLLSLLSMNIMPWGTLALATSVGAQLSGAPLRELAVMSSWTSFAVFPALGLLIFVICREKNSRSTPDLLYPLLAGGVLSCCLVFYNAFATPELAGVCAGFTTAALALLAEILRRGPGLLAAPAAAGVGETRGTQPLWRLLAPYLALIALIGLSRIAAVNGALQRLFSLESGGVQLFVFTSPGVFIFLTVLLMRAWSAAYRGHPGVFLGGVMRAAYPVAGIMLFVVFAQLHRASGLFEDLAARLVALSASEITFAAPLLGMLSGYATGSNVGGNALFMALQSDAGRHFEHALVFAALQNSASGHAVFLSLPIILLTLSIAAAGSGDADRSRVHACQTWLIRRALLCAPLIYAALVIPFHLLIR